MTPQLEEALRLLRLAQRDRDVFEILAGCGDNVHAAAGFHAQQAVEKALLCFRDIDFPRTHDLESLINRLAESGSVPPYAAAFSGVTSTFSRKASTPTSMVASPSL